MIKPPPPGVSTIDEFGQNRPIPISTQKRSNISNAARQRAEGRDPIAEKGVRVDPTQPLSEMLKSKQSVIEVPIRSSRPKRHLARYESIDGSTYAFQTHDEKGNPIQRREILCVLLAMREIGCGGSPFPVLDAFRVAIEDADGKQVYPAPGLTHEEPAEDTQGYKLGGPEQ